MGKLTTHVLNLATGAPAARMRVTLHDLGVSPPRLLCETHTNEQGRSGQALIEDGARFKELLVDVGGADQFLTEQLRPELLEAACEKARIPLTLRRQPGYDHSYYFISTFMGDHLRWHAERLKA